MGNRGCRRTWFPARTRVLATRKSNKNDPNDALSVAVTALRNRDLREVAAVGTSEVLRLLAKRNTDIGDQRTRLVCRLHALLAELAPGGIAKEINASDVDVFLDGLTPSTPVEHLRYQLALDPLDDVRRLDMQLKASHKKIRETIKATPTSLTDVYGIGPIIAATLIGYTGDIRRFRNRDRYAAYTGTAPVEFSSGGRTVHRLSRRGNRELNHAIHMAAICQLRQPHCDGRAYFDRKVKEGKTNREAIRSLKRQISNTVYRHLIALTPAPGLQRRPDRRGPGGQAGASTSQRGRPHIPQSTLRQSHSRTPTHATPTSR